MLLSKKWLEFEQISGNAQTIQDCQKAIRKVLPNALDFLQTVTQPQAPTITVNNEESKDERSSAKHSSKGSRGAAALKHTLFVKNLSQAVEEEDIQNLFAAKLPNVQIEAIRLIRDRVDSSKRGIAFVDVATSSMAEESLSLNESELKGQKILVFVSKSQADEAEAINRTVFLTKLPLTATEKSIRELFESLLPSMADEIEEIRLIRDPKGKVKGFAYL